MNLRRNIHLCVVTLMQCNVANVYTRFHAKEMRKDLHDVDANHCTTIHTQTQRKTEKEKEKRP